MIKEFTVYIKNLIKHKKSNSIDLVIYLENLH
jgi:hypothetical protein